MKKLVDAINDLGVVRTETILDVSQFLNAQVDAQLMQSLGKDFSEYFAQYDFDAFVTVETSGIAPSVFASLFSNKPLVIIKKQDKVMDEAVFVQQASHSFTKNHNYYLTVKKEFIENKRLILLDDFLAQGSVVLNVDALFKKVDAELVATGICISKNFQDGYKKLTSKGYDLYCQAQIKKLDVESSSVIFED